MINHFFIPFSAVQIYDLSYIHLQVFNTTGTKLPGTAISCYALSIFGIDVFIALSWHAQTRIDKHALNFSKKHKQAKLEFSDQDKLKKLKSSNLKERTKLKVLITDIDRRESHNCQKNITRKTGDHRLNAPLEAKTDAQIDSQQQNEHNKENSQTKVSAHETGSHQGFRSILSKAYFFVHCNLQLFRHICTSIFLQSRLI